mgnify:CR=1 FL=1
MLGEHIIPCGTSDTLIALASGGPVTNDTILWSTNILDFGVPCLLSYLKREQYGSWPIVYGQYFNAKLDSKKPYLDGNPVYAKDEKKSKYVIIDDRKKSIPNYSDKYKTFFPRMWSNTQSRHAAGYKQWAGLRNTERTPTFSQNLKSFYLIFSVILGLLFYLFISYWINAFKMSDINLKY